ncbi:MAG: diacylglycerol kinase [Pseudomonadota bacterium]
MEEIVDHLTDDWAAFAKHAKDLGSFAVMCCLIATGLYALGILTLT